MISKNGSHSSCVSHFRVRMDLAIDFHRTHRERERKKIRKTMREKKEIWFHRSESDTHTSIEKKLTHWTPIRSVRKKIKKIHVGRLQSLKSSKLKKEKKKGLTIFKKVFRFAVALVGESGAFSFQRPRLNFSLHAKDTTTNIWAFCIQIQDALHSIAKWKEKTRKPDKVVASIQHLKSQKPTSFSLYKFQLLTSG